MKIFKNVQEDNIKGLLELDVNVLLLGPTGSGKTETSKKVAKDLELDFYYCNAVLDEFKLTGFMNAMGHYQPTPFYEAFTKGGLFLFDEMDASIPEALLTINMALANGEMNFPNGLKQKHKDFKVIATANTIKGANINYTGRNQLDAASLNRFACLELDYDTNVECQIIDSYLNDIETTGELQGLIGQLRDKDKRTGVEVTISTRLIATALKVRKSPALIDSVLYGITDSVEKEALAKFIYSLALDPEDRKKQQQEEEFNGMIDSLTKRFATYNATNTLDGALYPKP